MLSDKKGGAMPPRSPGRPKAANPKDVRVTVRLTEQEADHLCRLAGTDSLSQAMRAALRDYLNRRGGVRMLPDSERAMVRRELRKAKRAGQTEDPRTAGGVCPRRTVFSSSGYPHPVLQHRTAHHRGTRDAVPTA